MTNPSTPERPAAPYAQLAVVGAGAWGTALAMVAALTTPYREKHPNVTFTIWSRTSIEILELLENLEIDAGITYLENEPLGRVSSIPLYHERYRLITSADAPLGNRASVTWSEVAGVPLCLLTPDMQNRRIIDRQIKATGRDSRPTLESDSMILLFSHVRTGRWASVMPQKLAETLARESGKIVDEAKAEVIEGLHMVEYVCGTSRQPIGVHPPHTGDGTTAHDARAERTPR